MSAEDISGTQRELIITSNGDTIAIAGGVYVINGQSFQSNDVGSVTLDNGAIVLTTFGFVGTDGPRSILILDDLDITNFTVSAYENSSWRWQNVEYAYNHIDANGNTIGINAFDGEIIMDSSGWSAEFGDVNLAGDISDFSASGTSTLGNMSGGFSGFDGSGAAPDGTSFSGSYGVFWGEGNGGNYAGGWATPMR